MTTPKPTVTLDREVVEAWISALETAVHCKALVCPSCRQMFSSEIVKLREALS